MKMNARLSTLVVIGVGAYVLWRFNQTIGALGPPSDELMQHVNQPVRPPIWDGGLDWITNGWGDGWAFDYSGDAATDVQRRFENGGYSTL